MNIVIIGSGIVGSATAKTLNYDVKFHDPELGMTEDYANADVVFICTPTDIAKKYIEELQFHPYVYVRSSIPFNLIQGTNVAMYPEFLTQRYWETECLNPVAIVIGCNFDQLVMLQRISKLDMNNAHVTDNVTAALMKISTNALASVKITFMNYLFDLCNNNGLKYDDLIRAMKQDPRVGNEHLTVPGPDGQRGFGGKCFPENCQVLMNLCGDNELLKTTLKENERFRG